MVVACPFFGPGAVNGEKARAYGAPATRPDFPGGFVACDSIRKDFVSPFNFQISRIFWYKRVLAGVWVDHFSSFFPAAHTEEGID